ncbi:MBL fold metallo-hydrolase RNA specificity domain-containing protein [Pararcticibacter amylolyticus]|uniref:MBL fold hydrolase n=1 Tax=Pararcticibacter amylolyticus TaxID=2173175 RepID=A0A2U2PL03_9SPHI|nr:MBL fold metallo-hydrolase [Pararcticibacter amylolyticus]PWG82081.1 MBL fold hydrolase [Pararcticibacter amylolyticus]
MKLTIWGAARQVTGSMHLLEVNRYKILIDCGLDYEKETRLEENALFPFDPASIDVVILTHAHIDHSGNLPTLLRLGFEGQILCTAATADLTELLLLDSVTIFENKARKQKGRYHRRGKKPHGQQLLYMQKHVMDTAERFVTIGFNKPFRLNGDVVVELFPAGHLLGAASVVLTVNEHGLERSIAFSGDIGRKNYPVIVDPSELPPVDYLVCESTYGGRYHSKEETVEQVLVRVIEETCIKSPGRLIIPAFSIGRTQALVYSLNKIFSEGLLPRVRIFVDSPMANYATDIFRKYHHKLNSEAQAFYQQKGDEFEFENLHYVQSIKESRELSSYFEPCIIVSSAGMLEGGRIQDHLFYNIQNYYCTILFIGYSAKGTLGHRLLRGDPIVHIRDRELAVYAKIRQTDVLSGHADHDDLITVIKQQDKARLRNIFLVHGEPESMAAMRRDLEEEGYTVTLPEKGETFEF